MILCDVSGLNANVMYELGVRQAFNKPVTIIRDSQTPRVFDIQGLRDLEYDASLRVDMVEGVIDNLSATLTNTFKAKGTSLNSLVQLVGAGSAPEPTGADLAPDTQVVLNSIATVSDRMSSLETLVSDSLQAYASAIRQLEMNSPFRRGQQVVHKKFGVGIVTLALGDEITIQFPTVGKKTLVASYLANYTPPELTSEAEEEYKDS